MKKEDKNFSHYFTNNNNVVSKEIKMNLNIGGIELSITSDNGVFSKNRLDYGTKTLLSSIKVDNATNILDVGCGLGIMGIYLAKLFPNSSVTMTDISSRAIDLANKNILNNGLNNIKTVLMDGVSKLEGNYFDLVVFNPPIRAGKVIIFRIFEEISKVLSGTLYIVNKKNQGAPSTQKFLESIYDRVEIIVKDAGFWVFEVNGVKK